MEYLKNTLEEMVINKVEKAFQSADDDICKCVQCRKDVTVYVLNNIKPRYIISTRGMLHEAANTKERSKIDEEIDILLPEGMDRVKDHKRPNFDHNDTESRLWDVVGKTERFTMTDYSNYNYPFFIGAVCDSENEELLSDVRVSLFVNGELAECWDGNWPNPYITSSKSGGKFAFWPRALKEEDPEAPLVKDFAFKVRLEHDAYQPKEIDFNIKMESQKYIINFVRKDYTKELGTVTLVKK